jgi:exopolysaccharide biosynthesis polyprenyl glycosylphosphotransferase
MALTTGITSPLIAATNTAVESVDAAREAIARPVPAGRRLAVLVVVLDVLAGLCAAALTVGTLATWTPVATVVLALAWPLALVAAGGHSGLTADPYAVRARALAQAGAGLALVAWLTLALAPSGATTTDVRQLAISTGLLACAAPAVTLLFRAFLPLISPRQPARVVLAGHAAEVRTLLREADRTRRPAFEPVAVCLSDPAWEDDLEPMTDSWPVPVWHGTEHNLLDVVRGHGAEAVVVAPGPGITHAELRRWGAWLEGQRVELLVSSGLRDVAPARLGLTTLGGMRLLRVRPPALTGPSQLLKSAVDRVGAGLLLVLLGPVLAVLALRVRTDSPGPALYRQTRVGRHGRLFTVYKLRTMCADADRIVEELEHANESDSDGVLFKIKRDPRITRFGAMLRKYSLDELPQLINVVRGEMSLIGPRPALPCEVRGYDEDVLRRLDVRPGMTGLWQVSGRSDLCWADTVRLDLQYVDNWSWRLDADIAVRTVTAVLSHRGAY